jgi:hypothetical protein
MTEGLFFVIELVAMLLVVKAVAQGKRVGRAGDLGFFAYRENKEVDEPKPGKGKPGA